MRPDFRFKALIYFVVIIIAFILFLGEQAYNFVMNQISGCTNDVLVSFISSDIAYQYQEVYIYQIQKETTSLGATHVDWSMKRTSNGCTVSASVTTNDKKYFGDDFLIDPKQKIVTGTTKGAQTFFSYYKGSRTIP